MKPVAQAQVLGSGISRRILLLSLLFSGGQVVQELVSEKLFDGKTNETNSMASLALLYSFSQQFSCCLLSFIMIKFQDRNDNKSTIKHHPPRWSVVLLLAGLVGFSSSCANWSVEFVMYPAKVVVKSTKLVPTMMVSPWLGNNKIAYTRADYFSAVLLSIGAAGFALSSGKNQDDDVMSTDFSLAWVGLLLLSFSALGDALIPNLQQQTMRNGARPEELALRVNFVSAFSILGLLFLSGNVSGWIELWFRDPSSLLLMTMGGLTFSVAVLSYTYLIVEAGSVAAVSVATIRKVVTLSLSYLLFPGKTVRIYHALSLFVFMLGLAWKPLFVARKSSPHRKIPLSKDTLI